MIFNWNIILNVAVQKNHLIEVDVLSSHNISNV